MRKRTLVIYGSFGLRGLNRHVEDWESVDVVEIDALLPEGSKAARALELAPSCHDRAARINTRTRQLLNTFLTDLVPPPEGLELSRRFRAACLSIDAWRIISPYLLNLEIARRLAATPRWSRIIVSPGAGVSPQAWRQLAEQLDVPLIQLPSEPEQPPLHWKLLRKWQAWRVRKTQAGSPNATQPACLPEALPESPWLSADPRLARVLAGSDWHQLPALSLPPEAEQESLRANYERWWAAWWAKSRENAAVTPPLEDDARILDAVGRHFCQQVYPSLAMALAKARDRLAPLCPSGLLSSAMWGKKELMYVLAANERGIRTGLVTLDDPVDPELSLRADFAFCDDARHRELALLRGTVPEQVHMIQSPRMPHFSSEHRRTLAPNRRGRIILADTFFSGTWIAALPLVGLWAARQVIQAARRLPGHDFFIKPHPIRERAGEKFAWTGFHHLHFWHRQQGVKAMAPPPNLHVLHPEQRLSELLEECDLLLNIESYGSFEAYALNVPVIHLVRPCHVFSSLGTLVELGADQYAATVDDLVRLIEANLHDQAHISRQTKAQQDFLRSLFSKDSPSLAASASAAFGSSAQVS